MTYGDFDDSGQSVLGRSPGDYLQEWQKRGLDPDLIDEHYWQKYGRPQVEGWRSGGATNAQQLAQGLSYGPSGIDPEMAQQRAQRAFTSPTNWFSGNQSVLGQEPPAQQPPAPQKTGGMKPTTWPQNGPALEYPTLRQKTDWGQGWGRDVVRFG
ncbi:MAG: hypothetical protein HQK57_10140 [Deltaproteobacteria bacterium]|nr:hypothetical protein [Deltaproteobacteria bacterium]